MAPLGMEYYVDRIVKEKGLQPSRVSVFLAMLQLWKEQKRCNPFQISRRKIMKLSGIKSIVTYHTCISELKDRGLFEYKPSYHPRLGSEVNLNFQPKNPYFSKFFRKTYVVSKNFCHQIRFFLLCIFRNL